ncbi:MAG TPA: molybdopterin cofactor-binding domain-containing protein [Gaiellaceae bacterium]|jgi:CO/xanthine dehydrogenase Mo-binding subunit
MTGLIPENGTPLHEKEFSRKSFLKGGGALIVGFSAAGSVLAGKSSAAPSFDPFSSPGPGDPNAVDSFLAITSDNVAWLRSGRIELGQGSATGLLILAAEELDMDFTQMRHIAFDTGGATPSPNTGNTGGSTSISQGGPLVRMAAAQAKQALLRLASANLGVPVGSLTVSKGVVSGGGKTATYGSLIGGKLFNVEYTGTTLKTGQAPAKPVAAYSQVGIIRPPRIDIPSIVDGSHTYAANVRIPGMLHGRVVRPRGQGAYGDGTNPVPEKIDNSSIAHIPNVKIVQVGNFLGVVAPKEYDAIQAAAQLKISWSTPPAISSSGNLWMGMRTFDSAGKAPARIAAQQGGNIDNAIAGAAHTYSNTFKYHYQMHAPIGPNVAVADVSANGAIIYSHVKDGYGTTRPKIAAVLQMPINRVRIVYYEGSSTFGGGAIHVDNGQSAAIMSKAVGAPVRVQYMRWDEHGWDNYSPATMWDIRGGVDANGNIVALDGTSIGMASYTVTPSESTTSSVTGIALPTGSGSGPGDVTYSGTQYNIANRRIIGKTLPYLNNYFKTSSLRAPSAPQTCFASEQMIDHLAYLAKMDPYQFRLQNITTQTVNDDPTGSQWKNVLVQAAQSANWQPRVANSISQTGNIRKGRGIALGGFASSQAGVVAEIEVNMKTGKILVTKEYAAQVAGLTVGPALVENQMSGALIMGTSRALWEEVGFNNGRVTTLDWVSYPLLRFKDHPSVVTVPVQRADLQPTGSGEPPTAPVAAAIGNAFFDATGVRLTEAPMTPARVRATLKAAGVA